MHKLPDEIWTDILDYLDPSDLLSPQRVSRQLLSLARDPSLWRNKVFERAPSAAHSQASRPNALAALTGALGALSMGEESTPLVTASASTGAASSTRASRRAMAVIEWDNTHPDEKTDWYSEYIARNAPLSTEWASDRSPSQEVRGMALFRGAERLVGTLEDGSLAIWDIQSSENGRRTLTERESSRSGMLFQDSYSLGESSLHSKSKSLGTAVENISIASGRARAFVAVENVLNEIDLEKMQLVSQSKYAWTITALSQESDHDCDLTVGTSWSLHTHDPRVPHVKVEPDLSKIDAHDDPKIAFLPNYTKAFDVRGPDTIFPMSSETFHDSHRSTNRLEAYARVEPGPQSILHLGPNDIVIAGRMPSMLFYDRRMFPNLRSAIYSGARLSAMTTLPIPPPGSSNASGAESTLIACGEYGGRGSLELYQLPWDNGKQSGSSPERDVNWSSSSAQPFSYKNRQEASSSKLLSVATQGARIVFSDSEGMLKWVERDGRGLARRWNINTFQINERGASTSGEQVVRKMIALPEEQSDRGNRGDGDLLVWTGERIGIVTSKPKPWNDHDELIQAFERAMNLNEGEESSAQQREEEYVSTMRRALERQADERRWMSRFGGRR